MNQAELQFMAAERIEDASVLLAGGRWSFAYYIAGYAVECALKSCVLSRTPLTGGIFKDKKFSEACFTHDFGKLIELAGLTIELNAALAGNNTFVGHWGVTHGDRILFCGETEENAF